MNEKLLEQRAEEYANKAHTHVILNWEEIKQAYIAGLHEGQPKWHDLRKDPNDLPVLETELLCQKYSGRCFVGYYHHNDNKFYPFEKGNSYDVTDVIAWCEIPQFNSE